MMWRDIATAPKDGRTVLVCRHMDEFGWIKGYARWEGVGYISGWVSNGFDNVMSNLGLAHPTHWMPLPPPPAMAPTGEPK
jgi:hypothetical protein